MVDFDGYHDDPGDGDGSINPTMLQPSGYSWNVSMRVDAGFDTGMDMDINMDGHGPGPYHR
jgi:hypothetical protein